MSPTEDGVVRRDTPTGARARCRRQEGGWACRAMDDDQRRLMDEIDRLKSENELLKAQVEDFEATMGLDDKADAYARTLSGGMRRRLLVAKAMVHNPPVLILDEPTAGVDIELRRQLWDYVKGLHERGTTIVLTTHYLEEAEALCDTIAIIDKGEVVACEPKETLLARISEKQLIVRPATPATVLPAALENMKAELRPDGAIEVQYNPAETSAMSILGALSAGGMEIVDISTSESDLEDVFLQLTSRQPEVR